MNVLKLFKIKKILLLNIFLTLYVGINLIGGDRGLISFFEKKKLETKLSIQFKNLENEMSLYSNKNKLLSKNLNLDYLDSLYRDKLKFGKKSEIIIKLNNEN
jgi:cell division protein DivIC